MNHNLITYTCPYCESYYIIYDGKEVISDNRYKSLKDITEKQLSIGRCKFCQRKNKIVPTTSEMDGLTAREDILNKFYIMRNCLKCNVWYKIDLREKHQHCNQCGHDGYNRRTQSSLRTYNPNRK